MLLRRLTIEFTESELDKFREGTLFHKTEWFEALQFLKLDSEIALMFRLKMKDPKIIPEDLFRGHWKKEPYFELLQHEKGGPFNYFARIRLDPETTTPSIFDFFGLGGYFMPPNEFRNGKFSVTFLGTPKEVRRFVQMANKTGARYRVVTVEDAKPLKSPMAILTEKQRRVLITAHAMGYYDIPKKTSITQLAKILRVARSTLDVELRRAERRLLVYSLGRA